MLFRALSSAKKRPKHSLSPYVYNTRARDFAAPGRLQMPAYAPVLTGPPLAGEPLPTACQCLRTCGLPYPEG